ncbi:MAG: hypothetical protein ACOZF2_18340 [Thermodesulfobacteriota bacterium]
MAEKKGAEKKGTEEKITFVYKYPIDYCPQYISGVWGGINPSGFIEAHFYSDHIPLPEASTHRLEGNKLIGKAISKLPEQPLGPIRIVKQGIIMDLDMAKSFKEWINEKIKALEKLIAESQ